MHINDVLCKLKGVKESTNGWYLARCPCHDDQNASLGIKQFDKGIAVKCHAGCSSFDIKETLGIGNQNYYDNPSQPDFDDLDADETSVSEDRSYLIHEQSNRRGGIVAQYDYFDLKGNLAYQAVRFENKGFAQRMPNGDGGWTWKLGNTRRFLYRLTELMESQSKTVFVVEGEKDVDNLLKIGFNATCNVGGAGKWKPEYSDFLAGYDVVICPDNDKAGRQHAQQVARSLNGKAASTKLLSLDVPPKGDISDWLEAGHTARDLSDLVEATLPYEQVEPEAATDLATISGQTDSANAKRFVDEFGHLIRYVPTWKKWLVWDKRRWKSDPEGIAVLKLARRYADGLWAKSIELAKSGVEDRDLGKVRDFIQRSNDAGKLSAMIKLARSDDRVYLDHEDLNTNAYLLNVKNGTLDLRTGDLKPHCQEDLITELANVDFDSSATCPRWIGALQLIFEDDTELIRYVQKIAGYSVSALSVEQILPILFGAGENGKSTFWNPLLKIMGDYATIVPAKLLLGDPRKGEDHVAKVKLYQKRLVTVSEANQNQPLNESLVKELTGGDMITARGHYELFWDFRPTHTLWLPTNHLPNICGTDHGIWRRLKIVPFNVRIRDKVQPDKSFNEKLLAESSGILNWLIEGFQLWQLEGLEDPQVVRNATSKYRSEEDSLGQFVNECCEVQKDFIVASTELFEAFKDWSGTKVSNKKFGKQMSERFKKGRPNSGEFRKTTVYYGIRIKNENPGF